LAHDLLEQQVAAVRQIAWRHQHLFELGARGLHPWRRRAPCEAVDLCIIAAGIAAELRIELLPFAAPAEVEHPIAPQHLADGAAVVASEHLGDLRVEITRLRDRGGSAQTETEPPVRGIVGKRVVARNMARCLLERFQVALGPGLAGIDERLVGVGRCCLRSGWLTRRRLPPVGLRCAGRDKHRDAYNQSDGDFADHVVTELSDKQMDSSSSIPRTPSQTPRDFERKRLLMWRESMPAPQRAQADRAIGERLIVDLAQDRVGTLALYWPIRGEPDLACVLARLMAQGWQLALPRVIGRDQPLDFGRWQPGQAMRPVSFGLMLPEPFEPVVPDVLVIPCVGFDRRGYRLGYGAGYYDRTLAARAVRAAGVAYDSCELATFDAQPHDRPLDRVLTETRTLGGNARR